MKQCRFFHNWTYKKLKTFNFKSNGNFYWDKQRKITLFTIRICIDCGLMQEIENVSFEYGNRVGVASHKIKWENKKFFKYIEDDKHNGGLIDD